jgi:hypothetical protein
MLFRWSVGMSPSDVGAALVKPGENSRIEREAAPASRLRELIADSMKVVMMRFLRVSPEERDVAQAGSLRYRTGERGQGTVEFLLVLPLVVTVLLGIMEFSIVVFSYNTITNAAQEGARYGTLHPAAVSGTCANPGAGIGDAVCRLTAGLDTSQVRYTATIQSGVLRVAVTYHYQTISRAIGQGGALDLSAAAAMLVE